MFLCMCLRQCALDAGVSKILIVPVPWHTCTCDNKLDDMKIAGTQEQEVKLKNNLTTPSRWYNIAGTPWPLQNCQSRPFCLL